jgi:hypothetical protein
MLGNMTQGYLSGMLRDKTHCKFLQEIVLKDAVDFLAESLLKVMKDFAYMYRPHLNVVVFICRGSKEVTVTLIYDSDAVYNACLHACACAIRDAGSSLQLSWADAIDVIDVCRRECRGAAAELVRQDVDTGIKLLRDLLKSANITHKAVAKADNGAVLAIAL